MSAPALPRRGFLRGLASLPLIGGGVALIGQPTAAAVSVTDELLHGYKAWLRNEHYMLSHELAGHDASTARDLHRVFYDCHPAFDWHVTQAPPGTRRINGWPTAPQPSTRAAIILSAAGVPIGGGA